MAQLSGIEEASASEVADSNEYTCLKENYEFVKNFLTNLKSRDKTNMTLQSKDIIKSLNDELRKYVSNEIDDEENIVGGAVGSRNKETENNNNWSSDDRKETGTRPKVRTNSKCKSREQVYKNIKKERENNSDTADQSQGEYNVKNQKKNRKHKSDINRSKADESSIEYSSSAESSSRGRNRKRRRRLFKSTDKELENESSVIRKLTKKLDMRAMPPMRKYNENSGVELEQYLITFEDYCKDKFKGKKYLWLNELEDHLAGKTLEGFQSIRDFEDDYDDAKAKFIQWHTDENEKWKKKARSKFTSVRPRRGESLHMYCTRIEALFKRAYPKHDIEYSTTLIEQCKNSVNSEFRAIIKDQILETKLKKKKVKWSTIKKCARIYDVDLHDTLSSGQEESKEIVINLNKSNVEEYESDGKEGNNRCNKTRVIERSSRKFNPQQNRYNVSEHPKNRFQRNYQPAQQRFQKPPPIINTNTCSYCKRFGHSQENCRLKLKACFICGRTNHYYKDCFFNKNNVNKAPNNNRQFVPRYRSMSPKQNQRGNVPNNRNQSVHTPNYRNTNENGQNQNKNTSNLN